MRKKIGKRIGPVPIALVAVLALAAFIAAGLLLVPNESNVTHAQGLTDADSGSAGGHQVRSNRSRRERHVIDARVEGGACVVSSDSVEVTFKNTDEQNKRRVAVYTTGGDDFSSVQAVNFENNQVVELGARGVDEKFLTIDEQDAAPGGVDNPGTGTITVSASMAKDGKVYVFGYIADNGSAQGAGVWDFPVANVADTNTTDLGIPLSVFVDDKKRTVLATTGALTTTSGAVVSTTTEAIRSGHSQMAISLSSRQEVLSHPGLHGLTRSSPEPGRILLVNPDGR